MLSGILCFILCVFFLVCFVKWMEQTTVSLAIIVGVLMLCRGIVTDDGTLTFLSFVIGGFGIMGLIYMIRRSFYREYPGKFGNGLI